MASLASVVRISARQRAVWRVCAGCAELAALAPDQTHCPTCQAEPQPRARRRPARAA